MNKADLNTLLVRNFGFWIAAAVVYPIAHWIPTASGQPPRIYDVLVPVFVLGLGLVSNALLGSAFRGGGPDRVTDAAQDAAPDRQGM